jgi:hypothetical protein
MKKNLFFVLAAITMKASGQGFPATSVDWHMPNGGRLSGGVTYGFNTTGGVAQSSDNTGSQTWSIIDINGDHYPDLVITAQLTGTDVTCFSPGASPYWKVYLNTGAGFATSSVNWSLPNGGKLSGGVTYGYNQVSGATNTGENTGSQTWWLNDMDGDSKPDLVVSAQLQGTVATCFSPGSNPYWNIFFNNGSGFATTATKWNIPVGGKLSGGVTYGFNSSAGFAQSSDNNGSQNWGLLDMNGDHKHDLVVFAQLQGSDVTCFSPGATPYWKVYLNDGSSFASTPSNWNLPLGGRLTGGVTYGFNFSGGQASSSDNSGSQSWSVDDMDGDSKPDLIIFAQLQNSDVTCFSPGSNPYWKIYFNSGNGFSNTATNWNLPMGGRLSGGVTYGFNSSTGSASPTENTGSQSWMLIDLDSDHKGDLVISAQLQSGNATCFSPGSSPYWKVYKNTGTGFNAVAVNWSLPIGGKLSGGVTYGFDLSFGVALTGDNSGAQSWTMLDINYNGKPDLVITAQLQGSYITSFSPTSSQYWKVFLNDGALGFKENAYTSPAFALYPNPNSGSFHIKSMVKESLTLTNELGQKLEILELNEKNNFSVEVLDLKPGIYFVTGKAGALKIIVGSGR